MRRSIVDGTKIRPAVARLAAAVLTMALFALIAPLPAPAASAAGNAKIESMNIRVQPEYDDPRVLAVLEPVLSSDTVLPLKAKFFISKKTTDIEVGMACEVPTGQGHQCKVYDTADAGGGWQSLTYSVDTARNLFLEYYWNPFKDVKDGKKSFVYEFKSPYPIKKLNVRIQQGKKAADFKIDPASTNLTQDQEGFTWHTYTFTDVQPDQVLSFNVNYTKTDPQPEITKEVAPPNTAPAQTAGAAQTQPGVRNNVRAFVFLFGILIIAVILAIYWRSQAADEAGPGVKPSGRPKPKGAALAKTPGKTKPKFCGKCGSDIEPGNKFCPKCGTGVA